MNKPLSLALLACAGMVLGTPAAGQVGTIDPNTAPPPRADQPSPGQVPGQPAPSQGPESQAVDPRPQGGDASAVADVAPPAVALGPDSVPALCQAAPEGS